MALPWLRLWARTLNSRKVQALPGEIFKTWVNLLCVAAEADEGGRLPSRKDLEFALRMTEVVLQKHISHLVTAGLIDDLGDRHMVHDWSEWQPPSDNSTQRSRECRERKKATQQSSNAAATPVQRCSNGTDTERERETETERELQRCSAPLQQDPPPPSRSAEDRKDFDSALTVLRGSMKTEGVAMELSRRADLPGVKAIEGWRWLNAARVMSKGAKAYTVDWLMGIARNTTREEFEAYGKAPSGGKFCKPDPGPTNQPLPNVAHTTPEAKARHEETLAAFRKLRAGNGRLPAV